MKRSMLRNMFINPAAAYEMQSRGFNCPGEGYRFFLKTLEGCYNSSVLVGQKQGDLRGRMCYFLVSEAEMSPWD
ncbi:hypothetical protein TNCT_113621 [Trichonephila clavata]|uniref:Uncharacterized protein n=1 Tax=Trichonephila clavata TaxID=2740835 RepID=A0A8X6FGN7_TRICU|nr:hypothetical protein TNCT_113621 [Trichonephila clavata]